MEHPDLTKDILRYFLDNPDAADDLEGVASWRMRQMIVEKSIKQTDAALRWLVEHQFLKQEQPKGGRLIFRLNHDKRGDARRFLEDDS